MGILSWIVQNASIEALRRRARLPARRQSGLARHPPTSFFVMAFAISWVAWSPWFLSEDGAGLLPYYSRLVSVLALPVGILLGPALSGFIMTSVTEGKEGIRRLLRRFVLWRVGFRWCLFALIGVPVVMTLGTVIVPGGLASFLSLAPGYALTYLGGFVLVAITGGSLLEEPGWRGFALPRAAVAAWSFGGDPNPGATGGTLAPGAARIDPSLTLTRTQYPAIPGNRGNKRTPTYAEFASPCNIQQPLTAHS